MDTPFTQPSRPTHPQPPHPGRITRFLTGHWLLLFNTFTGVFVGLPYLAPILMAAGYARPAQLIYTAYQLTCHQLPSHSYFIFGYQAAFCQRDTAIWVAFFFGGLLFALIRQRLTALPFCWWVLALIPIGLDGGTQLVGPLYQVLPAWWLTGFATLVWLGLGSTLLLRRVYTWQYHLFLVCFPLGMLVVHLTGPRLSNWELRTLTGAIMGLANVWFMFPQFEAEFRRA